MYAGLIANIRQQRKQRGAPVLPPLMRPRKVMQRRARSAARNHQRLSSGKGNVGSRSRSASMMCVIVGTLVKYGTIDVVERLLRSEANQTAW